MISASAHANSETVLMDALLKLSDAGGSIIQIRTREPVRAAVVLRQHLIGSETPYMEHDVVNGWRTFTKDNFPDHQVTGTTADFIEALQKPIQELRSPTSQVRAQTDKVHYFVYVNPEPYLRDNPFAVQLIQQYAALLPSTNVAMLFITNEEPLRDIPPGNVLVADLPTPSAGELEKVLRRMLEDALKDGETFTESNVDEDDVHQITHLGLGLTLYEFETYAAISIIEGQLAGEKRIEPSRLLSGIAAGKTAVVRQSEILELTPAGDIGEVGGMQRMKDWVEQRKNSYTDEAREFGVEPPKGCALVGVPGCLSGDTIVDYRRGARPSARQITLRDLHAKFNGISISSRPWEDLTVPTYLHSVDGNGRVFFNRVIAVLDSGVKRTVRVSFTDGTVLVLTPDHPILTTDWDFVEAAELAQGDTVLARGSMKPQAGEGRNLAARPPRKIVNVRNHPYGAVKIRVDGDNTYEYKRLPRARLVVEAHMNGLSLDDFIARLNGHSRGMESLRFLEPIYEVHHVDEDTMHDSLQNLVVMHKAEHARHHSKVENFNVEYLRELTVAAVEEYDELHTYDIQMEAPANNFVANGVIVHNTGKSLVAKAVAGSFGVPLVRLDFGRVFSKYVGDSESRVRAALKMVEAMAPCVLFVDEIDKGLGGAGGRGDSGTSSRVLGSFLTWLQECTAPVFTMVTANRVEGLPPELLRRGRFDQIFSVGMPGDQGRKEVLSIHLKKRQRSLDDFKPAEIAQFLEASKGYVPAEIESAVKDGITLAFNDTKAKKLEMHHLITALKDMVPMSVSHGETIAKIVAWAATNATPVEYTDASPNPAGGSPEPRPTGRLIRPTRR